MTMINYPHEWGLVTNLNVLLDAGCTIVRSVSNLEMVITD